MSTLKTSIKFLILGLLATTLYGVGLHQRAPVGSLEGQLKLMPDGVPLPAGEVVLTPYPHGGSDGLGSPRPHRFAKAGPDGRYQFRGVIAGLYELTARGAWHSAWEQIILIEEGVNAPRIIELLPAEPSMALYLNQAVRPPHKAGEASIRGFLREKEVEVAVHPINVKDILDRGNLYAYMSNFARYYRTKGRLPKPVDGKESVRFTHPLKSKDVEGGFAEPIMVPALPEGFYWMSVSSHSVRAGAVLQITNLAMVAKSSSDETLLYAVDIDSGKPSANVRVVTQEGQDPLVLGDTDVQGLLRLGRAVPVDRLILGTKGESKSVLQSPFHSGDFAETRVLAYTDRPVYRPGDAIRFKGVMRTVQGDRQVPPNVRSVQATFYDPEGEELGQQTLAVSPSGSFHGEVSTHREADPGFYRIGFWAAGVAHSVGVEVAAYRKPQFSIRVTPDRDRYFVGDTVRAKIRCEYFFGGPVVGARVNTTVLRDHAWRWSTDAAACEPAAFASPQTYGEFKQSRELITDENGEVEVVFATRTAGDPQVFVSDLRFTITVSATESAGLYVDAIAYIPVYRGDVGLILRPESYVTVAGDPIKLTVEAKEARSGTPVESDIKLEVLERVWSGDQARLEEAVSELSARTDSTGAAQATLSVPGPGSYLIRASTSDRAGRVIREETMVFVSGPGEWSSGPSTDLQVVLDRAGYKPGETATALIRTSRPGGTALLTVEGRGILSHTLVQLPTSATVHKFVVTEAMAPNAFVSVIYIRERTFSRAMAELGAETNRGKLLVQVQAERPFYAPGDPVTLAIRTKDAANKPVSAEVSVAVVDESLFAVRSDYLDPHSFFYPSRGMGVSTSFSFPELFLDGGEKGGEMPVRRNFQDTAAWVPVTMTDAEGKATVSFTLPDNLTGWRATAVGVTTDTLVGIARSNFKARKDITVRIQSPGFLTMGDQQRVAVVVGNDTDEERRLSLRIDAQNLKLGASPPRNVRVPPRSSVDVPLEVEAVRSGVAKLLASAQEGAFGDAMEVSLPVRPNALPSYSIQAGALDRTEDSSPARITFERSATAVTSAGKLEISVTPTLASALVGTLEALIQYRYDCVEQTMSRFVPAILVQSLVTRAGLAPSPAFEKVPQVTEDSMVRLGSQQQADGGFGWFHNDPSEPFLTSLVVDGLQRAERVGLRVRHVKVGQAIQFLENWAKGDLPSRYDLRTRAYVAFVLARAGKTVAAQNLLHQTRGANLSVADKAQLILAMNEAGTQEDRKMRLLDQMIQRARVSPNEAYWTPEDSAWGEETSALALSALHAVRPTSNLVDKAVRAFLTRKRFDGWHSTRDTAFVLQTLVDYLAGTRELAEAVTGDVFLNGEKLDSFSIDPRDAAKPLRWEVQPEKLRKGRNEVRIALLDGRRVYYAVRHVQFDANLPATTSPMPGVRIERSYHRMRPQRGTDGILRLLPDSEPTTRVNSGDLIQVRIRLVNTSAQEYVLVEDPIPSNCRVSDREEPGFGESWNNWWSRTVIRDDRVAFLARRMGTGTQIITYHMRAESPGQCLALPTRVENMYDPDRRSVSSALEFTIR